MRTRPTTARAAGPARAALAAIGLAGAAAASLGQQAAQQGTTVAEMADPDSTAEITTHRPPGLMVGIGSHALHIHCTGSGAPAVVFDAGLGGTSYDWVKVQPEVAGFTTACSYDRAGYGWSEAGPSPRTARRVAEELRQLLVYASVPPPYVLVGHSLGGLHVRMFAHRNDAATAGLVLVDATHEGQFERLEPAGGARLIAPNRRSFVISNHWEIPPGIPEPLRPLVRSLALTPRAIRSLYDEMGSMRASAQETRDDAVRFPNVPVQVIIRGHSAGGSRRQRAREKVWRDLQAELAGTSPIATLVAAPAAGHHVHLDSPEVVVRSVRELVDSVRGR